MLFRRLYYTFKPIMPWQMRISIRRAAARRTRASSRAVWPILSAAGQPPRGWCGWPEGRKFAFILTHDVEGPRGLAKCRRLAELEMSLGFRSSFNLIPEGPYPVPPDLRGWLSERGFEVGVHDLRHDGGLYLSREGFREKARKINRHLKAWGVSGFRSGFMFHNLNWIHDLDITYDSSTFDTDPFEPQPDCVATIFPFWVPSGDPTAPRPGYAELPYTLPQDSTLFLLLRENTPDIWIRKLDWIAERGGMALLNVHPDYVQFPDEPATPQTFPVAHYVRLLEHVRDRHAGVFWHSLPGSVARDVARSRPVRIRSRRKKVGILTYSFYESDTRVYRYGEALAQRGDEVEVLSLRRSRSQPRSEVVNGCRVIRLQDRSVDEKYPLRYLLRLMTFLCRASWTIGRSQMRRPYDVLHINNVPDFLTFAGWWPKLNGTRIILDIHDIVPELFASKFGVDPASKTVRLLRVMERASASFSDHVILANDLWVGTYTGRSAPLEKVSVLLNYVDRSTFFPRPRVRRDNRKIVIFPGSLQTHQGLDVAIRAFPRVLVDVPTAELHLYGEGSAKPALIRLAAELGLAVPVKFFDIRPTPEIAAIMAEADVGVVPKRADSFGNEAFSTKIWEFMSLGIPVIASSTKIERFYFDDSVLRFFKSGSSPDLARAIVDILQNPEAGRAMTARATAHVARNNWERRKADYLGLVDRLCPSQ